MAKLTAVEREQQADRGKEVLEAYVSDGILTIPVEELAERISKERWNKREIREILKDVKVWVQAKGYNASATPASIKQRPSNRDIMLELVELKIQVARLAARLEGGARPRQPSPPLSRTRVSPPVQNGPIADDFDDPDDWAAPGVSAAPGGLIGKHEGVKLAPGPKDN